MLNSHDYPAYAQVSYCPPQRWLSRATQLDHEWFSIQLFLPDLWDAVLSTAFPQLFFFFKEIGSPYKTIICPQQQILI